MLKYLHHYIPMILLTEFPKSGASWIGQLLSEMTGYDFPRQRFPKFKKSIMHGHYMNLCAPCKTLVFWRDPRDIMISWYYHTLHYSDKNHRKFVMQHRAKLHFSDYDDIDANLTKFIDFVFTSPLSPRFTFNDFFDFWWEKEGVVHCKYEDLSAVPVATLSKVISQLGLEVDPEKDINVVISKYSFSRQAKRNPGEENTSSYLRKGVVGDWNNHFTDDAKKVFSQYIGDRLIRLGYEKDNSWVL